MPEEGAESLTTNIYALHIAKLEKMRKYEYFFSFSAIKIDSVSYHIFDSFWCITCNKYASTACRSSQHFFVDMKKTRDEVQLGSIKATANFNVAVGKREMILEYLETEKMQLEQQTNGESVAKLSSIEKQLAENNEQLQKLRVKAEGINDYKRFNLGRGQIVSFCYLMKELQRENNEAMDEILQAEKILHGVSIRSQVNW
jgi:hypothetical protein